MGSFSCMEVALAHFVTFARALAMSDGWRISVVSSAYCDMRWRMPSMLIPLSCVSVWKSLVRGSEEEERRERAALSYSCGYGEWWGEVAIYEKGPLGWAGL